MKKKRKRTPTSEEIRASLERHDPVMRELRYHIDKIRAELGPDHRAVDLEAYVEMLKARRAENPGPA